MTIHRPARTWTVLVSGNSFSFIPKRKSQTFNQILVPLPQNRDFNTTLFRSETVPIKKKNQKLLQEG